MKSEEEIFKTLKEKIKDIEIAMFATLDEQGHIHSRPMSTIELDGEKLWFFSSSNSKKIQHITGNNSVNLSYSNPETQTYVTISGNAHIVKDREKMHVLWVPVLKAFFPLGLNDPLLTLIRIDIHRAEFWDAASSRMVQLYQMAQALITGKQFEEVDHEKFNINILENE